MENYVENAEGKMEIDEIGEDTGVVKVKIMKEYEETVINLLKDNWHEITGNPYDKVPPFPQCRYIDPTGCMGESTESELEDT